jgi:Cu+-exporting ATPase
MTEATTRPRQNRVTTTLDISGMNCDGCAQHVQGALAALPEVTARVDLAASTAEVHHPSTVSLDTVVAVVRDAGYTAEPARR